MTISRRTITLAVSAGLVLAGLVWPRAEAATTATSCDRRVLILSAMPLELGPLVARTTPRPRKTAEVGGRPFYFGQLAGTSVVLAMTGIGPVNARLTANAAYQHFGCGLAATVFSGVAGSQRNIGDVTIPARWTSDSRHWIGADPTMLAVASGLNSGNVSMTRNLPIGDPACLCSGIDAPTPVRLPQRPQVHVGGDGETSDPFGGHALPCVPGGGDIAGCEPCVALSHLPGDAARFAASVPGLLTNSRVTPPAQTTASVDAQDEETAAVAEVAAQHGVPFLGIRAVSDGHNDPLHLPGFPTQFLVYRQLAANNAAAVTAAFIGQWRTRLARVAGA
jgi:nucleoside phosphorylase